MQLKTWSTSALPNGVVSRLSMRVGSVSAASFISPAQGHASANAKTMQVLDSVCCLHATYCHWLVVALELNLSC